MSKTLISLILCILALAQGVSADTKKLVLIAGPITGHPKGAHEYEKAITLMRHLLEQSELSEGLKIETHYHGWPADPSTLDDADSIVLVSDGSDHREDQHPLYVGKRLDLLRKQMDRGCGFVQLHWSTFNPSRLHDEITEWVGGYFDYETGQTPNKWFSAIQTWEQEVRIASAGHPVSRGVLPFNLKDEYYYNLKFRQNDPRLTPILEVDPPGVDRSHVVAWTVEREDGGRGFGFTGGHFHDSWWIPGFRKMLLNAVVWSTGHEVPEEGVDVPLPDPARILIVTGHNHPAHDWKATTAALIAVLESDPRVIVDVSEDLEILAELSVDSWDAVVMNYCNWDRPGLSGEARKGLDNYLIQGGGLSIIHFANGAFNKSLPEPDSDWPLYRTDIVRRVWMHGEGRSGHDAYGGFKVEMVDGNHPVTLGLSDFETRDELYYRQEGVMPVHHLATARSKVTGDDEAMAMVYPYGAGRVFQTLLGHDQESVILAGALIRRGTVWAAGMARLSFDPPQSITRDFMFRTGSPWKP